MAGVFGEDELVGILFVGQDLRHSLVGKNPIVVVVPVDQIVPVADVHPDAERFFGRVGNELVVEFPGSVGRLGIVGPLLIDVGAGITEDAVIEIGVIPGHCHCGGSSGAATRGRAAFGILG